MNATIENERYRVEISTHGAELQRIWDKRLNADVLYRGDWIGWSRQSPLLFPIVGQLREGAYLYQGKRYALQKHGFAQNSAFALLEREAQSTKMRLSETPESMACYPWPFVLTVEYKLTDECLTVAFDVENPGAEPLPFSLGAHPGFRAAAGDRIVFEQAETCLAHRLDQNKMLTAAHTPLFDVTGHEILLKNDLFQQGAFILERPRSESVVFIRKGYWVRLCFGRIPWLGLWAFPHAPYVCIEPWHGVDDAPGAVRPLAEKPGIITLKPGEAWKWSYIISSGA